MKDILETYRFLNIDGSRIGLSTETNEKYFCTPLGATIIGWDNGIHYCFIEGFGDIVFCVNPETCCDYYVYPIAKDFSDFLRLILTTGNTNTLQQIIWWSEQQYIEFVTSSYEQTYRNEPELIKLLDTIADALNLTPIVSPYEYVKDIQKNFPYDKIQFFNEYYDTLGLARPDGTECLDCGFEFSVDIKEIELSAGDIHYLEFKMAEYKAGTMKTEQHDLIEE